MQKLIFLRIGLVLNLLEDAVGRLARARAQSRTADAFYCDFLYDSILQSCLQEDRYKRLNFTKTRLKIELETKFARIAMQG